MTVAICTFVVCFFFYMQKKPGLSFYAKDPQQAAQSLVSLLEKAESVVPMKLRQQTPVRVGVNCLRALGAETSEKILQAVKLTCCLPCSYLNYGLLAARAEILKVTKDDSNCILSGYHGNLIYSIKLPDFNNMVKPSHFEKAAKHACQLSIEDAKAAYPGVQEDNLPYLCMDLVYQYTLLVDGFAIDPDHDITLVKQVRYGDAFVEAAWPLGSAIEVASSA
ncbi:hypothetical protein BHE74_00014003 [Ensete ventricosum]|nr:hypothetical protein GW17_00039278 [Ensete ventricosum]RWW77805.1 hypothetical protein BHE74_00014003 [Ensete ventricosum]